MQTPSTQMFYRGSFVETKDPGKIEVKDRPARAVVISGQGMALSALMNTAFVSPSGYVFDPEVLKVVRGMFPAGKTYRFDMVSNTTIATVGSGVLNQAITLSPAVASYAEWPALSALFDEVQLLHADIQLMPQVGDNGQNLNSGTVSNSIVSAVALGCDYENLVTAPASYAAVLRLAKSAQVARTIGDRSGVTEMRFRPSGDRPFARTVNPATQDPPTGCVGSYSIATASALSASTTYYYVTVRAVVTLRNRS